MTWAAAMGRWWLLQSGTGALPTLRAAVASDVQQDDRCGPGELMKMRGFPVKVDTSDVDKDAELSARLWDASKELTGLHYSRSIIA